MFYFVIFDIIAFTSLCLFALNLTYLLFVYLFPIKRQQYLVKKMPLFINIIWLMIELIFCILTYLANYQFETIFHKQYSLESSIILTATLTAIFLVISLIFSVYLLAFNSWFTIYSPKELTNNLEAFETKYYLVENHEIIKLKNQQIMPNKKWIKIK